MSSTTVLLPSDIEVIVDFEIDDGQVILTHIDSDYDAEFFELTYAEITDESKDNHLIRHVKYVTLWDFIQLQLDEKEDELIEEENDGALEARADERNER